MNVNLFKMLSFVYSFYFKCMLWCIILYGLKLLPQRKPTSFWNQVIGSIFKAWGEVIAFVCRLAICKSSVLDSRKMKPRECRISLNLCGNKKTYSCPWGWLHCFSIFQLAALSSTLIPKVSVGDWLLYSY